MNITGVQIAHQILNQVYRHGAYTNIELNNSLRRISDAALRRNITQFVYGVVEKDTYIDFVISQRVQKPPKQSIRVMLRMVIFATMFTNEASETVNNIIEMAKSLGKGNLAGFLNAVARNTTPLVLPTDPLQRLSIECSCPLWIAERLVQQYGMDFAIAFCSYQPRKLTHIRLSRAALPQAEPERLFGPDYFANRTKLGCYVSHSTMQKLDSTAFVAQSLGSMLIVEMLGRGNQGQILDLCASPGGKAVYAQEINPDAQVTACDIHPHRVELLRKYASSLGARLQILRNDALVLRNEFVGRFDIVMCDVPCSGLGVVGSKPDIRLNRSPSDIDGLVALQSRILDTAAAYVRPEGRLLYSTCTVLREENDQVIAGFLSTHPDWCVMPVSTPYVSSGPDGFVRLFPHIDDTDGFFGCVLTRRNNDQPA